MEMTKRLFLVVILVGSIYVLFLLDVNMRLFERSLTKFSLPEELGLERWEPSWPRSIRCYEKSSTSHSFPELNASIERQLLSPSRRNIFFLETSCFGTHGAELHCRQACSVEAAARTNPNMSVNLFYLSPAPPSNRTKRLMELLLGYDNVRVSRIKMPEYIRQTPIERWYLDGALETSRWPNIHMSDFLRLLTLWKYGGIYLDLDVVVTKSLDDLINFVGFHSKLTANSAVLGLGATGLGLEVSNECLRDLMETYRADSWDGSSCGVLNRVTRKLCNTDDLRKMTLDRCGGFQVCPPSVFYPIHWRLEERQRLFTEKNSTETMRRINAARAVHIWNHMTKKWKVTKGVPYAQIAEKYCPLIYNHCNAEF